MTRPVARLGDMTDGVCQIHGPQKGKIITASPDKQLNGRGISRLGDTVEAECGHTGKIITGSSSFPTNGRLTTRIGDMFDGIYEGIVITGSPDIFAGD